MGLHAYLELSRRQGPTGRLSEPTPRGEFVSDSTWEPAPGPVAGVYKGQRGEAHLGFVVVCKLTVRGGGCGVG